MHPLQVVWLYLNKYMRPTALNRLSRSFKHVRLKPLNVYFDEGNSGEVVGIQRIDADREGSEIMDPGVYMRIKCRPSRQILSSNLRDVKNSFPCLIGESAGDHPDIAPPVGPKHRKHFFIRLKRIDRIVESGKGITVHTRIRANVYSHTGIGAQLLEVKQFLLTGSADIQLIPQG